MLLGGIILPGGQIAVAHSVLASKSGKWSFRVDHARRLCQMRPLAGKRQQVQLRACEMALSTPLAAPDASLSLAASTRSPPSSSCSQNWILMSAAHNTSQLVHHELADAAPISDQRLMKQHDLHKSRMCTSTTTQTGITGLDGCSLLRQRQPPGQRLHRLR